MSNSGTTAFVKCFYWAPVLLLGLSSHLLAADAKLGFVDVEKAIQAVDAGKKAKAVLEKEYANKKKYIESEQESLKKMEEEFKKKSLAMSDEAKAKKQGEMQERFLKFQETVARSQQEMQQKQNELFQPIVNDLRTVIGEIADKKEYTAVLPKNDNTVLWSREKDDLTSEVIAAYNKKSKPKSTSNLTEKSSSQKS